uniref:Lysosomal acid lipase/cholesteryl ester hydrolase-like isoform X2 n=1 Tax=Phascolarctos cinereus TaxID=38626 RepID=A0A6P5J798_PHACI|nr:lysosomal acid lipase/cholesteryl ester hydrolase-like isoform X2 [Phascolarctos cinereus]
MGVLLRVESFFPGNTQWKSMKLRLKIHIDSALQEFPVEEWAIMYPALISVDELARYDLPASVDYTVRKTGQKIYYVGHSQGNLLVSWHSPPYPSWPRKSKLFFASAPIFYLQHIKSLPFLLLLKLPTPLLRAFHEIRQILSPYDWRSPKENLAHYNQTIPLTYNLSTMKVPTALWSGLRDLMADPKDVSSLIPQIPKIIYHKILPAFDHLAFVFGVDAPQTIYYEIIKMIKKTL